MSDSQPASASRAVFLSYASQDAEGATRICEALRAVGVEVWFDQNELVGGDAWDAKIRKQIAECALFIPIISANTQARLEGYFRIEWKLAAQRTHAMAEAKPFLLPVVMDATRDAEAHVPGEFKSVQWTRLPAGETTPVFCARVKKLLRGEAAPVSPLAERVSGHLPSPQSERRASRSWLVPALVVGGAAAVVLALWQPWRAREKSVRSILSTAAVTPAAPRSEAQQLVAKARKILDEGDEMNRETYTLAEELLKKAESIDLTEASAWALHAQLSSDMLQFGLDSTPARVEAVQSQASRAVKLAPDSLEAALAMGQAQSRAGQDLDGVLQRMQAMAEKYPNDWRVWRTLGRAALNATKTDQGLAAVNRALQLLPDDPRLKSDRINLLQRAGRFPEAESAMVQALEGRTSARLGAFDVFLKLDWRGDLLGAAAAVQRLPAWFLSEDRGCSVASLAYLWAREPKKALEIVNRFPRDYIRNTFFYGPRAVLTAWAHEGAGESESAKADWQIVIQVADRELSGAPEDGAALHWKAWALARLGRTDEADRILRIMHERDLAVTLAVGGLDALLGHLAGLATAVGRTDVAIEQINNSMKGNATYLGLAARITKSTLRLNPVFDSLRGDPRFQALIDTAPGPEEKKENASAPGAAALDPKSVAVLAFANMSADKDNEYFSDGLSEEILDKLARNPALRVIARTSSFSYKGKNVPIPQVGRELNVGTIIEGSVRRAGNQLRITAQLINAADGTQVWSETYNKELSTAGIFAIQDEIAQNIATRLSPSNAAAVATGERPTSNLEAYDLYLRARDLILRNLYDNSEQVTKLLDSATRLDPKFALAWAWSGWVGARMYLTGGPGVESLVEPTRRAIDEALRLQPDQTVAHLARAGLLLAEGNHWEEMAREIDLAEAGRSPTADTLAMRGQLRLWQCEFEAAAEAQRQAMDLDPQNTNSINNYGLNLVLLGRYPEAMATLNRAVKIGGATISVTNQMLVLIRQGGDAARARVIFDSIPTTRWSSTARDQITLYLTAARLYTEALSMVQDMETGDFLAQWAYTIRAASTARIREAMGDAEGALHDYREALPRAEAYRRDHPESWRVYVTLARIFRGLGQKEEALAAARKCLALMPPEKNPYVATRAGFRVLVNAQARFGQMDEALAIVRDQIEKGFWRRNELLLSPDFSDLQKDPRFRAVAEKAPL